MTAAAGPGKQGCRRQQHRGRTVGGIHHELGRAKRGSCRVGLGNPGAAGADHGLIVLAAEAGTQGRRRPLCGWR